MSKDIISDLFDNTGFTALFSAVIGSIVGSVSGYAYNKKLEERKSNATHWVNRKETIYSPLYAQILALKEYLEKVAAAPRPFARITTEPWRAETSGVFDLSLWHQIKRDTRFDYIPNNVKNDLDNLYKAVEAHAKNQRDIYGDSSELCVNS